MFIDRRVNSLPIPFGGADFKWSFTTQEPFRSSERNRRDMVPAIYKHLTPTG